MILRSRTILKAPTVSCSGETVVFNLLLLLLTSNSLKDYAKYFTWPFLGLQLISWRELMPKRREQCCITAFWWCKFEKLELLQVWLWSAEPGEKRLQFRLFIMTENKEIVIYFGQSSFTCIHSWSVQCTHQQIKQDIRGRHFQALGNSDWDFLPLSDIL